MFQRGGFLFSLSMQWMVFGKVLSNLLLNFQKVLLMHKLDGLLGSKTWNLFHAPVAG
jgi:hypothetical protein